NGTAPANTPTTFINSFSLINSASVNGGQLICTVSTNGGAANTALVLATGVTSLTILYGVTIPAQSSTSNYLTAAQVTAAGAWANVRLARISLTFQTG